MLLNQAEGIRDDLIVDCGAIDAERGAVVLVINAACADSDTAWIRERMTPAGLEVIDIKADGVLLALQGPEAIQLLEQLSGAPQRPTRFGHRMLSISGLHEPVFTARTGYTGEDGVELLLNAEDGRQLWGDLLQNGVTPCGLGARDTLRPEAAMHLYGQDMDAGTNPFEAGLGWLVTWKCLRFCWPTSPRASSGSGPREAAGGAEAQGPRHRSPPLPRPP